MPFESKIFDYDLPEISINQNPYNDPNNSKLLDANTKKIIKFKNLSAIIKRPSLFIMNKSTVQNVRVVSRKSSGGLIEIFFLEILEDNDDVQGVSSNFEVDEAVMSSLTS